MLHDRRKILPGFSSKKVDPGDDYDDDFEEEDVPFFLRIFCWGDYKDMTVWDGMGGS